MGGTRNGRAWHRALEGIAAAAEILSSCSRLADAEGRDDEHRIWSQEGFSPCSHRTADPSSIILETDAAAIAARVSRPKADTTDIVINEQTLLSACEWLYPFFRGRCHRAVATGHLAGPRPRPGAELCSASDQC